jgi:aminopeptidase N
VRNTHPIIGEHGLHRRGSGDMYDKGQLVLNTLRSVINDDELWFSILRGIQQTFRYQTVSGDQIFHYINSRAGKDLAPFFDQYFRHSRIPVLVLESRDSGGTPTVRYRWEADVPGFQMPIKVSTAPGQWRWIAPTDEWQTIALDSGNLELKVAEDQFYVEVRTNESRHASPGVP